MKKMAFVDLCNFTDWPMGGMVRYELMILETLEQYYDIDLWGVSVDGEASQNIIINNKPYPLHIFANAKRKNRVIPNYWKGLLVKKFESCFLNYDIIYVHTGSCLLALAHVAQVENALLVYHQHGLQYLEDYSLKTLLQKPFMNKAQKLADCSFVVTAKQELEEYTNGKKGYLQEKLIAIGSPVEERKLNWNKVAKRVEDRRDKRCFAIFAPSSISIIGSSVPSRTGTPTFFIATFDAILSPKSSICSGFGPIKIIPFASQALAKSAFSLKNPYPG